MKKILLVYATMTGYTQSLVKRLFTAVNGTIGDYHFDMADITDVSVEKVKEYKLIVLGASTWDGNSNFASDEFFNHIVQNKQDLTGVQFALFGVGDRSYPDFCGVIDIIKQQIILHGGTVHGSIPKIDSYMDSNIINSLVEWLRDILYNKLR